MTFPACLSSCPLKRNCGSGLPTMAAWAHEDPWKVMRGSIDQFRYFRRPKGITYTPIIRLLKLECQITFLWGKIFSISYENSYYLMLIRVSDWQPCVCLINKVWNKNNLFCLDIKIFLNSPKYRRYKRKLIFIWVYINGLMSL